MKWKIALLTLLISVCVMAQDGNVVVFDGNDKTQGKSWEDIKPGTFGLSTKDPYNGQKTNLCLDVSGTNWWAGGGWNWYVWNGSGDDVSACTKLKLTMKLVSSSGMNDLNIWFTDAKSAKSEIVPLIGSKCATALSDKYATYEIPLDKFGGKFDKKCVWEIGFAFAPTQAEVAGKLCIGKIEFTK